MTQTVSTSLEGEGHAEEGEESSSLYKPERWQWKTIALVAAGQAIPGFYVGLAFGAGVLLGSLVFVYLLVLISRFVADRFGWDDDSGVFAQVSVLAAALTLPGGVISIPALAVYVLALLVMYIPLQLLISGGRAVLASTSGSEN